MKHDVFVSHSSKDKSIVYEIVEELESNGLSCWISSCNLLPGNIYGDELIENIKATKVVILIFSKHSNSSPWVKKEIERAIDLQIPVLPIMIDKSKPSGGMELYISDIHQFHTSDKVPKNYSKELSNAILAIINKDKNKINFFKSRPKFKSKSPLFYLAPILLAVLVFGYTLFDKTTTKNNCYVEYKIVTGAIVGNYYKVAEDLRKISTKSCVKLEVVQSEGSLDNLQKLISDDSIKLAITQSDTLQMNEHLNRNIGVLYQLYNEELHILVRADSNISGFSKLIGKSIGIGEKRSGSAVTATYIYEEHFKEKMINPNHKQLSEALDDLRDGDIDAIMTVVGRPASEFNKRKMESFKLIPYDINLTDTLSEKYSQADLEYSWIMKRVKTISTKTLLVTKNSNQSDKHLKQFIKDLKNKYRKELMEKATDDINTPMTKWHNEIPMSELPKGLKYHSIVKDMYN